jgi:putative ABC transport system ATP-binding protein
MLLLKNVQKTYAMGEAVVHALRGIDLHVSPGEFIAIMGASGSGKSTLMNIIDGTAVAGMTKNQLAALRNNTIGFVFQGFNLLSKTTALENVELPLLYQRGTKRKDVRRQALASLKAVGLAQRVNHEPSQLSGGQQQRIAIARALDSYTSIEIMAIFQELNDRDITVVLVTHETDIAAYAKRLIEMRDGRIIKDEPIANRKSAVDELKKTAPTASVTA